ncbi:MAG: acyl-CoA carboxylase epsilon subunit [bacterium]
MNEKSISVTKGNPTEDEAAAIAAAIDLFAAEMTTPAGGSESGSVTSNWQRAALREAVEARMVVADVWGASPVSPY